MGCIALEDIEPGTLILKEKPQCSPKIGPMDVADGLHSLDDHLCSLVDSFLSMNKDDQKEYLALYNKYLDPNSLSDTLLKKFLRWKRFAQLHEEKWISISQFHIDRHFILKVICIFSTNAYFVASWLGGVFIKSARFNSS